MWQSLLVAFLIAASPAMRQFSPEGAPFSLEVPADWEIEGGLVTAIVSPLEGPKDTFRENFKISVSPFAPGMTLDQYVKNSLTIYAKIWTVKEQRETTLGGVPATYVLLDQKIGPVTTRVAKYFLAHEGQAMVLSGAAEPKAFERYAPTFARMAQSFQLKSVAPLTAGTAVRGQGFTLVPGSGWKLFGTQGGEMLVLKRDGADGASLIAAARAGDLASMAQALRNIHADRELGTITQDVPFQVGGLAGRKFVIVSEEDGEGDTTVRYMVEKAGRVAELRFKVDLVKPPASLLSEFEAIAHSLRWD